ncbi:MAG: aspartate aminotransferase family protein [Candidatus Omnitrophica bacterium]|nr:aspartate aminotransferase family protein [Candidatus Omnitrophota bacterium]
MNKKKLIQEYKRYVMPTYTRKALVIVKGHGSNVWDINGRKFLDFFPGWAVSGLGHRHPLVVSALAKQLKNILHVPNNYFNALQGKLAKKISQASFDGKVFFCNSGAEAVEAAIKLARRHGSSKGKFEIITMKDSFHGRSLAALAATGQAKYKQGFAPLPGGFIQVPFNDLGALKVKISKKTIAVMLELIQGEGGINVAKAGYIRELRKLCTRKGLLLILDEVQTAMGRTGKMFCYQHYNVQPDIVIMAKSLGGGFPIGAIIAQRKIADTLKAGTHASTFGGSPLACACSLAVFQAIEKGRLLAKAQKMGAYLYKKLAHLKEKYHIIKEIRGKALMLGVELRKEGKSIYEQCLKRGLLINCTHGNVLRIMPQIGVSKKEIDKAMGILDSVLQRVRPRISNHEKRSNFH